jgi:hypothetical protein
MSTVRVYGHSDDLIEIEGDLSEEFGAYDSDPIYLGFSDGTVLAVDYTDEWRISIRVRGSADLQITTAADRHEGCYSDEAVLTGDIKWVVKGTEWVR